MATCRAWGVDVRSGSLPCSKPQGTIGLKAVAQQVANLCVELTMATAMGEQLAHDRVAGFNEQPGKLWSGPSLLKLLEVTHHHRHGLLCAPGIDFADHVPCRPVLIVETAHAITDTMGCSQVAKRVGDDTAQYPVGNEFQLGCWPRFDDEMKFKLRALLPQRRLTNTPRTPKPGVPPTLSRDA